LSKLAITRRRELEHRTGSQRRYEKSSGAVGGNEKVCGKTCLVDGRTAIPN